MAKAKAKTLASVRDRVKEHRKMRAGDILPNRRNFRTHSPEQTAATLQVLQRIGFAGALLAYEKADGTLELIDGHLRQEILPDDPVSVLITDLSEDEAKELLLTHDALGAMAGANAEALEQLLSEVSINDGELQAMLQKLAAEAGVSGVDGELKEVKVQEPPSMTWVLVGIPTVRFGEINEMVESIAQVPGVLCEVTANSDTGPHGDPEGDE